MVQTLLLPLPGSPANPAQSHHKSVVDDGPAAGNLPENVLCVRAIYCALPNLLGGQGSRADLNAVRPSHDASRSESLGVPNDASWGVGMAISGCLRTVY